MPKMPTSKEVNQEWQDHIDAGTNSDPTVVGGRQPIYCPQCKEEVGANDSYHLSLDNQRYHYPVCWQRKELGIG